MTQRFKRGDRVRIISKTSCYLGNPSDRAWIDAHYANTAYEIAGICVKQTTLEFSYEIKDDRGCEWHFADIDLEDANDRMGINVGDIVKISVNAKSVKNGCSLVAQMESYVGQFVKVTSIDLTDRFKAEGWHWMFEWVDRDTLKLTKQGIEKSSGIIINKNQTTFMSIVSKIKLALTSEPNKTLINRGLINRDESFTSEGRELLDSVLLKEYGQKMADLVATIPEETK